MKERPLTHYALLSVAAAMATFFLKLVAWKFTGSVGMLSDALESLANVAAAFVALASLAVAVRPEDEDHAFGHSKAEYFAAGIEGALILLAAAAIGVTAVERFFAPQVLTQPVLGMSVSGVASLVNLAVARVLMKVGRARRSLALEADAKHLLTDVWTSVVVVVGVALVALTGWQWLDPALGVLLAFHIIAVGIRLVRESMHGLMDSSIDITEQEIIRAVLAKFSAQEIEYHALRTRRAGALKFVSVHLLMPGAWTILQGHDLAEQLESDLRQAIPGLIVFTHLEPKEDPKSWEDVSLKR